MTLTSIDADLINYDFYDSLVEAEASFFESMFLMMTYIAYACTAEGNKQKTTASPSEIDVPEKLIPKRIGEGHIVDLSSFKISPESLLDVFSGEKDGIEIKPRPGINLSSICLFKGLDTTLNMLDGMTFFQMIFQDNDEKNSDIEWGIVPIKDVHNLKSTDILSDNSY